VYTLTPLTFFTTPLCHPVSGVITRIFWL